MVGKMVTELSVVDVKVDNKTGTLGGFTRARVQLAKCSANMQQVSLGT